ATGATAELGCFGGLAVLLLGAVLARGLFRGLWRREGTTMWKTLGRAALRMAILGTLTAGLFFVPMEDAVSGPARISAVNRVELRAGSAGFLREIYADEGDRVNVGAPVARLEIPDLGTRTAQKRAEIEEAEARLRLLNAGPKPEEEAEQRH